MKVRQVKSCLKWILALLVAGAFAGCAGTGPFVVGAYESGQKDLDEPHASPKERVLRIACDGRFDNDFVHRAIRDHIVEVDEFGKYRNTRYRMTCEPGLARDSGLATIADRADYLLERIGEAERQLGRKPRVVFVVHGGLVSREVGLSDAIAIFRAMELDPEFDGYPIFVNWRSGGIDAYAEQALYIRNGRYNPWVGVPTAPFVVASDIVKGVADTPTALGLAYQRVAQTFDSDFDACVCRADPGGDRAPVLTPLTVHCPTGISSQSTLIKLRNLANVPLGIGTGPPTIGLGRAAWENMVRRTRNPLWREEVALTEKGLHRGAIKRLLDAMTAGAQRRALMQSLEFDLIGHSMGAMVAANIVSEFPELRYKNIVFMGAAISIRSFSRIFSPFLHYNSDGTRFYNLSLLPSAEANELTANGFAPSGSLLEWIDELYESPPTLLDRTLGKWSNVRNACHTFPRSSRQNMTFRVFGLEQGEPARHGDFNDVRMCFWRQSFWAGRDWDSHRRACLSVVAPVLRSDG